RRRRPRARASRRGAARVRRAGAAGPGRARDQDARPPGGRRRGSLGRVRNGGRSSAKGTLGSVTTPLWRPTQERAAASRMEAFRRAVEAEHGVRLPDYDALHAWSVREPEAFWGFLARYLRLPFATPPSRVRSGDPMPLTRWFEGATLSYARALLRPPDSVDGGAPAVVAVTEAGAERTLSRDELFDLVARVQAGLRRLGVGRGDHVVALAANLPETLA